MIFHILSAVYDINLRSPTIVFECDIAGEAGVIASDRMIVPVDLAAAAAATMLVFTSNVVRVL